MFLEADESFWLKLCTYIYIYIDSSVLGSQPQDKVQPERFKYGQVKTG